jgi:glutamine cyclotransferase
LISCSENPTRNISDPDELIEYTYNVLDIFPHDETAFTQGFVYRDSLFFEGTGLYGQSSLRRVDPISGEILQIWYLSGDYFGEGITILDNKIYQLTWKSKVGFIYDYATFDSIGTFSYQTEGWGLTHNGVQLIMSDGSDQIYFIDPASMVEMRTISVSDEAGPIYRLNELEYISGKIYANIWYTDLIVIIDPNTGNVTGRINLEGLREPATDVLNGIAWDEINKRLFVTGKKWPKIFHVELIQSEEN